MQINDKIKHLSILHSGSKGYITVAKKQDGRFSQYHYKENELERVVGDIDYFISPNTFYTTYRRIDTLKELNALYIDLDIHNTGYTKDGVIFFLENDFYNTKIPIPNIVIDSGRGLHLVWLIKESFKSLPRWQQVENYLCNTLKEFGADPIATDPTRVLRVAGTYNTKSNSYSKILDTNDYIYTLNEIITEFIPKQTEKKAKLKIIPNNREYKTTFTKNQLYFTRLRDLKKLCEIRNWDMENYRELIIFLYRYYTNCFVNNTDEGLRQALELNNQFIKPLAQKEVIIATRSAEKSFIEQRYKYSNKKLIDILGITEEEQKHLKTIISKKEANEREKESKKKKRRNENGLTKREQDKKDKIDKIKELLEKGLKQVEIAKELNVSDRYIRKIKQELQT